MRVLLWYEIDYKKQTEREGGCVLGWMQVKTRWKILEEKVKDNKHQYKKETNNLSGKHDESVGNESSASQF